MRDGRRWPAVLLGAALLAACGGDAEDGEVDALARGAAAEEPAAVPGPLPPGASAEEAALGRTLYREVCIMCHGPAGEGTQLGPSLVDDEWIREGGGAFEEILRVVHEGVAEPEDFPVPMPAAGGGALDQAEVRAVAAYVYSLAHRASPPEAR